jgi:hypothetical protein
MDIEVVLCECGIGPDDNPIFSEKEECPCESANGGDRGPDTHPLLREHECGTNEICRCITITVKYNFLTLKIGDVFIVAKLIDKTDGTVKIDGECTLVKKCKNTIELCACDCFTNGTLDDYIVEVTMVVNGFKCKQVITKKVPLI